MNVLATLLFAHLIADFPLQTNWVFRFKLESWLGVVLHSAIHVVVTAFLLVRWPQVWPVLLILGILHFICDWLKTRPFCDSGVSGFLIDQLAHVTILSVLAIFIPADAIWLPTWALYSVLALSLIPAGSMFSMVWQADTKRQQMNKPQM